jgi:hypothetical protein
MTLNWIPDIKGAGGATTLNVDLLGTVPVGLADGATAPGGSTIIAGQMYQLWYDGRVFRVLS